MSPIQVWLRRRRTIGWILSCLLVVSFLTIATRGASASHLPFEEGGLLFQPCVQRELKLDRTQIETMILLEKLYRTYNDPLVWPTTDLRRDFIQLARGHRDSLYSVMSPPQRKRFHQIRNQLRGVSSMYTPLGNIKTLELQDDQIHALFKIVGAEIAEEQKFLRTHPPDDTLLKRHFEILDQSVERALKILNARQRALWKEMVGEPFHWDERDGYPFIENALDM